MSGVEESERSGVSGWLIDLNRPEYVAVPELLLVALAWSMWDVDLAAGSEQSEESGVDEATEHAVNTEPRPAEEASEVVEREIGPEVSAPAEKARGLVYSSRRKRNPKSISIMETSPVSTVGGDSLQQARMASWVAALTRANLEGGNGVSVEQMASALASSITIEGSTDAKAAVAMPISPMTALLQDPKGLAGRANPPAYATMIEQLFHLGTPLGGPQGFSSPDESNETAPIGGAAGMLASAWSHLASTDPLTALFDGAAPSLLPSVPVPRNGVWSKAAADLSPLEAEIRNSGATPMHWFVKSWRALTATDSTTGGGCWIERLSPWRWADWASFVLRLAFGFGFLWECRFYRELVDIVLAPDCNDEPVTGEDLHRAIASHGDLMSWPSSGLAVSVRETNIRSAVRKGVNARNWFQQNARVHSGGTLLEQLSEMRQSRDLRDSLARHMSATHGANVDKNMWETINYALGQRRGSGDVGDPYATMRTISRFRVVDPGPEWLAVFVSLSAGPGGNTTIKDVVDELGLIGMGVEVPELLRSVERSGLAELAADADLAVVVRSAF